MFYVNSFSDKPLYKATQNVGQHELHLQKVAHKEPCCRKTGRTQCMQVLTDKDNMKVTFRFLY